MVQTIGFIGAGKIGGVVAELAIAAGYDVVLSNSRGPQSLSGLVKELGPKATAKTAKEIANDENITIVLVSIPLFAIKDTLTAAGLKNKIVLDTSNYYPDRDTNIAELDSKEIMTTEYVARFLDKSNQIVKVFNNIDSIHLKTAATTDVSKQTTLPIAGDAKAKDITTEFLNKIGYEALDVGTLKDSYKFEANTPAYGWPYVPKVPEDLDAEGQKNFFVEQVAEPVSKSGLQKYIDEISLEEYKPGGTPTFFPKYFMDAMMDLYIEAQKKKAAN